MIERFTVGSGEIMGPFHRITPEGHSYIGGKSGFRLKAEWSATQELNSNITLVNINIFFMSSRGFAITHSNNHRTCRLDINNHTGGNIDTFEWKNLNANINHGRQNLLVSRTFEIEHDENGRAPGSIWIPDTEDTPGYWDQGRVRIDCSFWVNIQGLVGRVDLGPMNFQDNLIRIPNIENASDAILRMPNDEITGASNTTSTRSWEFPNNIDVVIDPKSPNFHHYVEIQVQNREGFFTTIKTLEYMPKMNNTPQEYIKSSAFTPEENTRIANFLSGFESRQTRFIIRTYTSTAVSPRGFENERQIGEDVITSVGVVTPPVPISITGERFEITGLQSSIPIVMEEMDIIKGLQDNVNVSARLRFQLLNKNGTWVDLHSLIITDTIRQPLVDQTLNNQLISRTSNSMIAHIRIVTTTEYRGVSFFDPFESNIIECFYDENRARPVSGPGAITSFVNTQGIITVTVPFNAFLAVLGANMVNVSASANGASTRSISYPQSGNVSLQFPSRTETDGNQIVAVTASDSRGNFLTREITVNVGTFNAPVVFGHAERVGETSEVEIGCYGNASDIGHIDTLYRYRIEGEDWSESKSLKCAGKNKGKWVSEKTIINIPTDKNAEFEFLARDSSDCNKKWSKSSLARVATQTPLFHIDPVRNSIGVGILPEINNQLSISNAIDVHNFIRMNASSRSLVKMNSEGGNWWQQQINNSGHGDERALVRGVASSGVSNWHPLVSMKASNGNQAGTWTQGIIQPHNAWSLIWQNNNRNSNGIDAEFTFNRDGSFNASGGVHANNLRGTIHGDRIPWGNGLNQVPRGNHIHSLASVGIRELSRYTSGTHNGQDELQIGRMKINTGRTDFTSNQLPGITGRGQQWVPVRGSFIEVPRVLVTARTSVPGFARNSNNTMSSGVLGVSYGNVSTNGFDIFVSRTNSTGFGVDWIAIGPNHAVTPTQLLEDWKIPVRKANYLKWASEFEEEFKNNKITMNTLERIRPLYLMMTEKYHSFNEECCDYLKREIKNCKPLSPGQEGYTDERVDQLEKELDEMKVTMRQLLTERNENNEHK